MYTHNTHKRVRYGETDQMGYLYHGNYALLYEIGRLELLRSLGLSYRTFEEEWRVMMPVVNMSQRFIRPARFDELVTIQTQLREKPSDTVTFHYELSNESGKLLNGGRVQLYFAEVGSGKRVACPTPLTQALGSYFG